MPRLACHSIGSALDDHDMPRLTPRLTNLVVIVLPKLLLKVRTRITCKELYGAWKR